MRRPSLRLPGLLLVVGFLGVLAGSCGWLAEGDDFRAGPIYFYVVELAPPIGYGLVGWAWWQWMSDDSASVRTASRASRILAVASLAFAATYAALLFNLVDVRLSLPSNAGFPDLLSIASDASIEVGFLLAGIGFWIASRAYTEVVPVRQKPDEGTLVSS